MGHTDPSSETYPTSGEAATTLTTGILPMAMRLTSQQQIELRAALRRRFGASARLWVFGSRTDDLARGGDYDLMVQTDDADARRLVDAKLAFLADLHATPSFEGEKLDLVLYSRALDPQPRPIHLAALAQGVELS